jgi:hypothetical protein
MSMARNHPGIVAGLGISALLAGLFAVVASAASGSNSAFGFIAVGAALAWSILAGVTNLIYRRGMIRSAKLLAWLPSLLFPLFWLVSSLSTAVGILFRA